MAWTSDIIWCDPKIAGLSDRAFRAYINANSYSSGFVLRGELTSPHLRTIGVTPKAKAELVAAGLWHDNGSGGIHINDWDEHNGKRDDRRHRDRERKRQARAEGRWNESDRPRTGRAPSPAPSTAPARGEGSEGSEGSDG